MMGSELHLHVYTDDETRLIVRVPTMTLSPEMRAAMVYGARMWLTFNANVMHFFDDETKHNILKIDTNDIY